VWLPAAAVDSDQHRENEIGSGRRQPVIPVRLAQRFFSTFPVAPSGMLSTNVTSSGVHHLAILPSKNARSSSRFTSAPGFLVTTSSGRSSHFGCLTPMHAAIATAGWAIAMFSRSIEPIHSPPDLMTSLLRSVICMNPSASIVARRQWGTTRRPGDHRLHL
jgi:hypothetical protein